MERKNVKSYCCCTYREEEEWISTAGDICLKKQFDGKKTSLRDHGNKQMRIP